MAPRFKTKLIFLFFGIFWFLFILLLLSVLGSSSNDRKANIPNDFFKGVGLQNSFQQLSIGNLINKFSGYANTSNSGKEKDVQIVIYGDDSSILGVIALMNSVQANTNLEWRLHFFVMLPKKLLTHFNTWLRSSRHLNYLKVTVREHISSPSEEKLNLSKIYMLDIFPELEGIFIYLNSDAIVRGDILELAEFSLKENELALGSNECHTIYKHISAEHPYYSSHLNFTHPAIKALHLNPKTCTFNTGFFIANATVWRKNKVPEAFRHWAKVHEKEPSIVGVEPFADVPEAILLLALYNRVGYLPSFWHIGYLGAKRSSSLSSVFVSKFKVLEWNGRFKPWHRKCPFTSIWHKYYIKDPNKLFKSHSIFAS